MDFAEYSSAVKAVRASKRLGQSFLMDIGVAKAEAEYARGRTVIELGAGLGVLTNELCSVAKKVIAVEYDRRLFEMLSQRFSNGNLTLLNGDFFELDGKNFEGADIMVSNIPYNLSSKVLMWLSEKSMPAVLCLQKEFVERMLSKSGTREYSRLSAVSELSFKMHRLMRVSPDKFYPQPRVTSEIIYLKPSGKKLSRNESEMINLLMMHKKKKLRNAIIDSAGALSMDKSEAAGIADGMKGSDTRVFKMDPESILDAARRLDRLVNGQKE
jgi:16S rRNA (adenine1518-N6/adenine1519-N6)-dimethyltransferase